MRSLIACVAVFALASVAADEAAKKAPAELQGTWKLESISANGEERRAFEDNAPRLVIKGDRVRYGGEPLATLKADPETTPKCLDLHFVSATDYEGVYKVEKDTLTICYVDTSVDGAEKKDRPTSFDPKKRDDVKVITFVRKKR